MGANRRTDDGANTAQTLRRQIGLFGAVMLGLGSIIGTGVFVSIGIAAGIAGPAVLLATAAAAVVAACNALSSAQLAANHPVSGGTYEYGYRLLHPALGFTAGWMFLCAKTASAATAALGCAAYLLRLLGQSSEAPVVPVAIGIVLAMTLLVAGGIRRSSAVNSFVVLVTLASLAAFVVCGVRPAITAGADHLIPFFAPSEASSSPVTGLLEATALMFVAYTGYGRIATLAEEVRDPKRNVSAAIVVTLVVSMTTYLAVGLVAIAAVGANRLAVSASQQAATLEVIAHSFGVSGTSTIVAIGAITAMLGVLLNLILGTSRVVLAMARRNDAPSALARITGSAATPLPAVILMGSVIAALVLIGDVKTTWSFSAFTVLVYYALTNLAALRLRRHERRYPRAIAWTGLAACLMLAIWVEPRIWLFGLGLMAAGLAWHWAAQRARRGRS